MQKSTIFFVLLMSVWFVSSNVSTLLMSKVLRKHDEMIESLQRRVPATFKNDLSSDQKPLATIKVGSMFLKNPEEYKQADAVSYYFYRKHICESLGGTYREDFNTDQYDDGIPGYNGLREGAVYECSRVEPIFLAN